MGISFIANPVNAVYDLLVVEENREFMSVSEDNNNIFSIHSLKAGLTNILVTEKITGIKMMIPVQIGRRITSASIVQQDLSIQIGEIVQLDAAVVMGRYNFENQLVCWYSDNPAIAEIDQMNGRIKGVAQGQVNIQLKDLEDNVLDTCIVTVVNSNPFIVPSSLAAIADEAFMGINASCIVLPTGLKNIGSGAFANAQSPRVVVHIPASVTYIADDAFAGCSNVIIYGESNSEAEVYTLMHSNCSFVKEE